MKLLTENENKKLFEQYHLGSDLEKQEVVAKIFNPYGMGTWYLLNSDPEDPDYIWAIVDLFEIEVGSVSRHELESIRIHGLPLERDKSFTPINAAELLSGIRAGTTYAKGGTTRFRGSMDKRMVYKTYDEQDAIKWKSKQDNGVFTIEPKEQSDGSTLFIVYEDILRSPLF